MNRQQRRHKERDERRRRRAMWPSGDCEVPPELWPVIPLGAKFTIAGVRRNADGTYDTNCAPGQETVFVNNQSGK